MAVMNSSLIVSSRRPGRLPSPLQLRQVPGSGRLADPSSRAMTAGARVSRSRDTRATAFSVAAWNEPCASVREALIRWRCFNRRILCRSAFFPRRCCFCRSRSVDTDRCGSARGSCVRAFRSHSSLHHRILAMVLLTGPCGEYRSSRWLPPGTPRLRTGRRSPQGCQPQFESSRYLTTAVGTARSALRMLRKQVTPRGRRLRAFREIVRVGGRASTESTWPLEALQVRVRIPWPVRRR